MAFPGKKLSLQGVFHERASQAEFFDHFMDADCLSRWNLKDASNNSGDDNSEVQLQTTGRAGVVNIICDTDANEEAYMWSNGVFKWNGLLPWMFQARMVGDNETTDNAYAWTAGMCAGSVWTAGNMIADGGLDFGYATGAHALFFKPYGTNRISVSTCTSASTYQTTETQNVQEASPPAGNVPFVGLKIECIPHGDDHFDVIYYVDEDGGLGFQQCLDNKTHKPIKHSVFFNPSPTIAVGAGLKSVETSQSLLRIDYIGGVEHALRYSGRE